MKPKDVALLLESIVEKKIRTVPLVIKGESGIGKSQIVQAVAKKLQMGCIDLRLAQQEVGDLIGLPRTNMETKRTVWLAPEWFPTKEMYPKGAILFLDEMNRGPVDVRQCIFQLLTELKMHTHTLPDDVYLVAAVNPDEGKVNYQVEQLDVAMNNRLCFITMEHDVDQWVAWARENDVNDLVIRFITVNTTLLLVPAETGSFPSPRSWVKLSDLLNAEAIPQQCQMDVISGLVGDKAAVSFIRFMDKEYKKPVSGKEILEDYAKVKEKMQKQRNDETYATITDLVGLIGEGAKLDKKQLAHVISFTLNLKAEEQMALLKKLPNPLLTRLGSASAELCNKIAAIASELQSEREKGKK